MILPYRVPLRDELSKWHPLNKNLEISTSYLSIHSLVGYLIDITTGLQYIHNLGYIHLDIKPGNIVLTPNPRPRHIAQLCDFGSCIPELLRNQHKYNLTIKYSSPEVTGLKKRPTSKYDTWSLGMTILDSLTERNPLSIVSPGEGEGEREGEVRNVTEEKGNSTKIRNFMIQSSDFITEYLDAYCEDLYQSFEHPAIRSLITLSRRLLSYEPSDRPDDRSVLESLEQISALT